jgi:hypothetical protein
MKIVSLSTTPCRFWKKFKYLQSSWKFVTLLIRALEIEWRKPQVSISFRSRDGFAFRLRWDYVLTRLTWFGMILQNLHNSGVRGPISMILSLFPTNLGSRKTMAPSDWLYRIAFRFCHLSRERNEIGTCGLRHWISSGLISKKTE